MNSRDARLGAHYEFSPTTSQWFSQAFHEPTPAQDQAWSAIGTGAHTLVVAPTGSGKTLAAFLSAIDSLTKEPYVGEKAHRCRVLYISPLKALASDIDRNLRSPLVGINRVAEQLGQDPADITVSIRTGDTSTSERRKQAQRPSDILITTPESLFLLLTSQARESLRGVETVIIDEIHAVAGSKRGAHLAVSLERLDELLAQPAQRIGLSATVTPIDEVARFLGGQASVVVVNPPSEKLLELDVVVPVKDLSSPGSANSSGRVGDHGDEPAQPSIWPHVENRIVDLINEHTSTLVFANSRRLAERLTARLNEISAERNGHATFDTNDSPAEVMAQAGSTRGTDAVLARAHHGSVSKEQRAIIEDALKAGRMPAVVATSSLELGIDMGSVDLVIQVEAPPSVASGLQRVGRAGHQVGEVSRATLFPKHRGDLLATSVITDLMERRQLEPTRMPTNALDVLAQHVIAAVGIDDEVDVEALFSLIRRAAPYAALPRSGFDAVLDMLAGRYPSDEFSELRPRLVWDRDSNVLRARPGAQRIAVTSGGTIPDRGLFGVFMVGEKATRVGELDEEMVYESRVGDVFALGASSWRIEDITTDRVLVTPAPGRAGKLPFWHGDALGRPAQIGTAIGELLESLASAPDQAARELLTNIGLDAWATNNLLSYVREQLTSTEQLPTHRTFVVERFRDELGDWRVVLHSPFGARVHAPWALAVSARLRDEAGIDAQVMHADDGIVMRLPDTEDDAVVAAAVEALFIDPDEISDLVTASLGSSALFASRFRECASRALLLPRRTPGKRTPLWQQRQRSAQLLSVASKYPEFPIVLETVRECLQDVYDVPTLEQILRDVRSRTINVTHCQTEVPSPFARSLLFNYVASFIYEGDSPLAERRAAALTLDTELLAELLGFTELRELLDAEAIAEVAAAVGYLAPERHATSIEQAADLLRNLGPLSRTDAAGRGVQDEWIDALIATKRAIEVRVAGEARIAGIEDASRLRDALGVALPVGVSEAHLASVDNPLADLLSRYARTHGPFPVDEPAAHFGLGVAVVLSSLQQLSADGRVVSGEFRPGHSGAEWCDANVLRRIRRKSIAALRQEAEPVEPATLGVFLPQWQHIDRPLTGVDGLYRIIGQLSGVPLAASTLETLVLPSRVRDYQPAMLDELLATGDVLWTGAGALSTQDGWLRLVTADNLSLLARAEHPHSEAESALAEQLAGGGAWLFQELCERLALPPTSVESALWNLTWQGNLTNDTLAPVRALIGTNRSRSRRAPAHRRRGAGTRPRLARPARGSVAVGSSTTAGRWAAVPATAANPTQQLSMTADVLLDRYGVVSRAGIGPESIVGGFSTVYRTMSALEDMGRTRRGYFIEGLGAAQFALPGAVDQLRECARAIEDTASTRRVTVLAATDPANPYGAAVSWPISATDTSVTHKPGRKVGALVVLVAGRLTLFIERGGKSCLTFGSDSQDLSLALDNIVAAIRARTTGPLAIQKIDGKPVADSPHREMFERSGFVLSPRGLQARP